jgi:hypothetical protein
MRLSIHHFFLTIGRRRTMLVEPQDGRCRECGGQLKIVGADDVSLTVECQECDDTYDVETDAFGDGAIHYWPTFMAEQLGEGVEP